MEKPVSKVGHSIDNGPLDGFPRIIKSEIYQLYEIIDEISQKYTGIIYIQF